VSQNEVKHPICHKDKGIKENQSLQVLRHKSAIRCLKERLFRIDSSLGLRVSKWNSWCLIDSTMELVAPFKLLHN